MGEWGFGFWVLGFEVGKVGEGDGIGGVGRVGKGGGVGVDQVGMFEDGSLLLGVSVASDT